ncbi:MAG: hypothetical protein U0228_02520 [Myxococcaceae bacterium]
MRKLLAALVASLLVSCGVDNGLGGSMGEVFPLDVSGVDIHKNDETLQITYLLNRGVFLDVVARVSVSLATDGMEDDGGIKHIVLKPGTRISLGADGGMLAPDGTLRTWVTHAPGGEPTRNMPNVKRGDLIITTGGNIGEFTKGNFSMLFEDTGGDLGFGRTLTGTFSATVLDGGFEPFVPDAGP